MNKKTMRLFYVILACGIFLFINPVNLFAENVDDIVLPNLTTEIEGEAETLTPEILLPLLVDFELPEGTGDINLELPDFEINSETEIVNAGNNSEKLVFAEGQVGAGFPGYFIGDFSVYRISGDDPFRITFNHESAEGYSGTKFSSGYNDKTTFVSAEKKFAYKNFIFDFAGIYKSLENGLQNKEPKITSINQRNYKGKTAFSWNLPKGFLFYTGFDLGVYNRFADTLYGGSLPDWANDISVLSLMPELKISWNNEKSGVSAFFSTRYWYDNDMNNDLNEDDKQVVHRGEFKLGLSWKNDFVEIYGDAAAVVGNQIGYNDALVPFTVGVNSNIPIYFSNRKLKINAAGGLESNRSDIGQLEEKYKFSLMSFMPKETSNWFGKIEMNIPLKTAFTANIFSEYRHTAFENKIWQPVYDNAHLSNGGYKYESLEQNLIKSQVSISYTYKIFTINAGWLSFWDFVPVGEDRQSITLDLAFQSVNSVWGATIKSKIGIITGDYVPVFGLEAFVRVTPQVRIAVQVEDTIKLIRAEPRSYAGCRYFARSGSASMLVKFFF